MTHDKDFKTLVPKDPREWEVDIMKLIADAQGGQVESWTALVEAIVENVKNQGAKTVTFEAHPSHGEVHCAHSGGSWKRMHLPSALQRELVEWLLETGRATGGSGSATITL